MLSTKKDINFDENMVDGGVESVNVDCEEGKYKSKTLFKVDYFVAMLYIAECFAFKRPVDFETFDLDRERNKILDVVL